MLEKRNKDLEDQLFHCKETLQTFGLLDRVRRPGVTYPKYFKVPCPETDSGPRLCAGWHSAPDAILVTEPGTIVRPSVRRIQPPTYIRGILPSNPRAGRVVGDGRPRVCSLGAVCGF